MPAECQGLSTAEGAVHRTRGAATEGRALVLFGRYRGTIRESGFFWVHPFASKRPVSLKAVNVSSSVIKVNDLVGNPIEIGAVVVYPLAVRLIKGHRLVQSQKRRTRLQRERESLAGQHQSQAAREAVMSQVHTELLTIIDLRTKFGLSDAPDSATRRVVVVKGEAFEVRGRELGRHKLVGRGALDELGDSGLRDEEPVERELRRLAAPPSPDSR